MSSVNMKSPNSEGSPADPTYRQYTPSQAATYAQHRPSPPPALVELIFNHHISTGGQTGVLLDVGCGPGMATRAFAKHFEAAIGCDPGESMIQVATEHGGETANGKSIRWVICTAEEIEKLTEVEPGSVDLVIVAFAAHWFDMPRFWTAVAEVMRPGGTVALWTSYRKIAEPTTAEEAKVQAIFMRFRTEVLDKYNVSGNKISSNAYRDLVLPWDTPVAALFDQSTFSRKEFTRQELYSPSGSGNNSTDTAVKAAVAAVKADPLAPSVWKHIENLLDTVDPVTRWREAHPGLAGTEEGDCVKVLIKETVEAVKDGQAKIDLGNLSVGMGLKTVVLMVKGK